MKRKIVAILLSATMVLGAVSLSACANNELEAKLAELQTQITELQDQNEELQAKVTQQQAQIVQLEQEKQELENEIEQLESEISASVVLGTFYSLEEAYQRGLLTQQDLMSIAYYHNGGREGNEELMPEDYTPQPKSVLSSETELKIKQTYKVERHDVALDNIHIKTYFGTYGNCVSLRIGDDFITGQDLLIYDKYTIGEVNFIKFYYIDIWYEI